MKNLIIGGVLFSATTLAFAFPEKNKMCIERKNGEVQCLKLEQEKKVLPMATEKEVYVVRQANGILEFSDQKTPDAKVMVVNTDLNMF